jgi:YegS/Rv2252/BmrU family lipid kinase
VVVNPTKFDDGAQFRSDVVAAMRDRGWSEPLWLETTAADPGAAQARAGLRAAVDLIVASGGDGTVTACAAVVAGSGTPLAVLPTGTGNLLARNLGLPLDLEAALAVALEGADRQLDMGSVNGMPFIVMAGIGLDAKMLDSASEPLKKRAGWAAYVVAALRHLLDRPMRVTLRADDGRPLRRRAAAVIIGNVGSLQGGVPLLPDALPDDGLLDVVVLSARGIAGWLALTVHVLLRRRATSRVAHMCFRELRVELDREQPWELDGEVMGSTRRLQATIQQVKLVLRVPREAGVV